jgi:hypothetical protein
LKKKNATLSANILNGDIDRVISSRISYSAAKDLVIYPEELRHKADTYVGSAGSSLRPADLKLKEGMTPFKCWVQYGNETVRKFTWYLIGILLNFLCIT